MKLNSLINKSVLFILTACISLLLTPEVKSQSGGQVIDKIVAKIDNYIVLKSDVENAYYEYLASGQQSRPDLRCRILESLITNKLMVAKAEIDSVIVSDEEVDSNLERKLQYFIQQIGSEERIEQYYGKTMEQFKAELREREKEQLTVQRMQQTISENVSVTPAEVKEFFYSIPQDSLPYFSKEVTVGQIVLLPDVSKEAKDKAKAQLSEFRERVIAGEDLGRLARQYSHEPSAKDTGGDLGYQPRGVMDPKFEAAALGLKIGEISKPFETSFGLHIVKLLDRRGNLYRSQHIILIPETTEEDIQRTVRELDSLRSVIINDSLRFEQAATDYSDDKMTSGTGGYFVGSDGSNSVSVKELDGTVYFTIDTMQVGDISKPMVYKRADGKDAVRIFYYQSSKSPHQANLKDDYQKLYTARLNQKKSRILNKWFDEAKGEVFINIDEDYDHCNLLER